MYSFQQVQEIVSRKFEELTIGNEPSGLYDPIRYILSGQGKRIRPTLLIMAANLYLENPEIAIEPALGLEIFHNFTLIHDDIMDNADKRRNKPTVHKKWDI